MIRNYYQILEVARTAGQDEIKKAYRKKALKYHPDRNKTPEAEGLFNEVTQAYDTLSDPGKRAIYDDRLLTLTNGNRKRSDEYEAWLRKQAASRRRYSAPQPKPRKMTRFDKIESGMQLTVQLIAYAFGLGLAVFLLSLPIFLTLSVDWRFVLSFIFFTPLGYKLLQMVLKEIRTFFKP